MAEEDCRDEIEQQQLIRDAGKQAQLQFPSHSQSIMSAASVHKHMVMVWYLLIIMHSRE
jgi:hypothetical protein